MNIIIKIKVATLFFLFVLLSFNHCYGQIQDTTVYKSPDTYPEFRYGDETSTEKSFKKYFNENFRVPAIVIDQGVSGRIYIEFVVEKEGSISQVKVLRGIENNLDKEVLEIIKKMPKWIPGTKDGKAVRTHFLLPILLSHYGFDEIEGIIQIKI